MMDQYILPTISNDFKTGQPFVGAIHPSLKQLNDYITRKFKHDFVGVNTIALTKYMTDISQSWSKGKYYLYGQLPISVDTPLTNELLQQSINLTKQRSIDYGVPYNNFEAESIRQSEYVFQNLLELLRRYYQHPYDIMEMYRPDGEFMKQFIEDACGV